MTVWTEALSERLKTLWIEGNSGGACSRIICAETGLIFSRNSIIGRVHRMKLPARQSRDRPLKLEKVRPQKREKPLPPQPKVNTVIDLSLPFPVPEFAPDPILVPTSAWQPLPGCAPVPVEDIKEHHCRWPVEGGFCGQHKAQRSYCAYHADRAYPPPLFRVVKRKVLA